MDFANAVRLLLRLFLIAVFVLQMEQAGLRYWSGAIQEWKLMSCSQVKNCVNLQP